MKWDDALDVWAAHGVGGFMGAILLGVFALKSVNPAGADGLITGNWTFFGWQVLATVVCAAYAFVATFLILKLIKAVRHDPGAGLRGAQGPRRDRVRRDRLRPDVTDRAAQTRSSRRPPDRRAEGRGRKGAAPPLGRTTLPAELTGDPTSARRKPAA